MKPCWPVRTPVPSDAACLCDLPGSDPLHYGDGEIIHSVENGITYITLQGHVTPGPDYKLYLTPKYVDTKAGFEAIKAQSVRGRYQGV